MHSNCVKLQFNSRVNLKSCKKEKNNDLLIKRLNIIKDRGMDVQ